MPEGQCVVDAEKTRRRAREHRRVLQDDDERHERDQRERGPFLQRIVALRVPHRRARADARMIRRARKPGIEEEHQRGGHQQHDGQRGALRHVVHADDRLVDDRAQHFVVAAQQERIAEVGKRVAEQQQHAARDPGHEQRQLTLEKTRDGGAPMVAAASSSDASRFAEQVVQQQVGERKVGEDLRDDEAAKAVQRRGLEAQQLVGDDAAAAVEQDQARAPSASAARSSASSRGSARPACRASAIRVIAYAYRRREERAQHGHGGAERSVFHNTCRVRASAMRRAMRPTVSPPSTSDRARQYHEQRISDEHRDRRNHDRIQRREEPRRDPAGGLARARWHAIAPSRDSCGRPGCRS